MGTSFWDTLYDSGEEQDQCSLPGIPSHTGRLGHLLHHPAHGDPVEADHRVVRGEHGVQGVDDVPDWWIHSVFLYSGGHQH